MHHASGTEREQVYEGEVREVLPIGQGDVFDHEPIRVEADRLAEREVLQVIVGNYLDAVRVRETRLKRIDEIEREEAMIDTAQDDEREREAERRRATRVMDQRIAMTRSLHEIDEIIAEHAAEMRRVPELAEAENPDGSFDHAKLRRFLRYDAGLEARIHRSSIGDED